MPQAESLHGAVMVTKSGSTVTARADGFANVEANIPCTIDTRFQLCSVSKQFTAVAVLLLVESGRLDLHQPVDAWLEGAPPQWGRVTLHHVLSHTAGIPHWLEGPGLDPEQPMSISNQLDAILAAPLRDAPGAQWHYSSPGYLLAGTIVEKASGQPYRDFISERILSPLQLAETTVGAAPGVAARGYNAGAPVTPFDLDAMAGSGDIRSTVGDLTRFTIALHGGELITTDSLRAMCTAHASINDDDGAEPRLITTGYGYGMFTGFVAEHPATYHTGDNPGYRSLVCWIRDLAASIVILINDEAVNVTTVLRQLLPAALEP